MGVLNILVLSNLTFRLTSCSHWLWHLHAHTPLSLCLLSTVLVQHQSSFIKHRSYKQTFSHLLFSFISFISCANKYFQQDWCSLAFVHLCVGLNGTWSFLLCRYLFLCREAQWIQCDDELGFLPWTVFWSNEEGEKREDEMFQSQRSTFPAHTNGIKWQMSFVWIPDWNVLGSPRFNRSATPHFVRPIILATTLVLNLNQFNSIFCSFF